MSFTRIGELLWSWEPFTKLSSDAKILWLALYTGPTAKRYLPGLWHGTPQGMADDARMPAVDAMNALDKLLEAELVEYDAKHRLLRFTELPDAGDWPAQPYIMKSWWSRFQALPACAVRDAHVPLMRWLLDKGAATSETNRSGKPSLKHEELWAMTFGTVQVPVHRKRGMRRLEIGTATAVQPSLFDPPPSPSGVPPETSQVGPEGGTPGSDPDPKEIRDSGYHLGGTGEGEGEGEVFSSSGSGATSPGDRDRERPRPKLTLVPMPTPADLTPEALVAQLAAPSAGRYGATLREGVHAALCERIADIRAAQVGEDDLALLAAWIARGYGPLDRIAGDPETKLSAWASYPGAILRALDDARARGRHVRAHEAQADDRSSALQEAMKALGWAKETV